MFAGRSAIVTGGASGIGRAIGAQLAATGAHVTLADIDGDAAARVARELLPSVARGGTVSGVHLDTRDVDEFRTLVRDVAAAHGGVDFLFNNAGISLGGPTHELAVEHWDRIVDVNIRGVVNGVVAAYPMMVERGRGHIVNTASAAGLVAPPFVASYAMTKHAVVGLCAALRPEAALHGVRVSALCPGSIETPILDRLPDADLPATKSVPVTAREFLAVVKQKPIPADRFATGALRGVARNRGIIVVPSSAKSLWYLQRCSPRLMEWITGVLARRVDTALVRDRV